MSTISFKLVCFSLFVVSLAGQNVRAQNQTVINLDSLVTEALNRNPRLQAARHQTEAAATKIRQVRAWEPPQIGIEFFQTPIQSFPDPISDGMETDYFIQQMIPFPGKISAEAKAARSSTEMFAANVKALERDIILQVKSAYYRLYLAQQKIRVHEENLKLVQQFLDLALKRYELGLGKQGDVFRAQTQVSRHLTEELNLKPEEMVAIANLDLLLDRPTEESPGYVPDLEVPQFDWRLDQLQPLAMQERGELQAARANIAMNRAGIAGAKREYFPDLMVRFMYKDMVDTGDDFWALMGGVSVPFAFWSKGSVSGKVQEAELNTRSAEASYKEMQNMVTYEVHRALVDFETNRNKVKLSESSIIPQAEQSLQSTIAGYQTGNTEFLMLIVDYQNLLDAKLDYFMAVTEAMTSLAMLEQAVGLSTDEIAARLSDEEN